MLALKFGICKFCKVSFTPVNLLWMSIRIHFPGAFTQMRKQVICCMQYVFLWLIAFSARQFTWHRELIQPSSKNLLVCADN